MSKICKSDFRRDCTWIIGKLGSGTATLGCAPCRKRYERTARARVPVLPKRVRSGLGGGGGGIRTPETLSGLTVFKTAGFNHSPTPPPPSLTGNAPAIQQRSLGRPHRHTLPAANNVLLISLLCVFEEVSSAL